MQKIKIGVIGFGFMGRMHAAIFNELPQYELAAVCDVDAGRFAAERYPGIQFYTDYNELLRHPGLDAVSICVSDKDHFGPAVAAARAGKDIFLEKPVALDLEEARQIVAEAKQAGVKLMIGFLLHFDPRYAGAKDLLAAGKLGDIVHIHARRNSPKSEGPARYKGSTPLVFHVTIHDLDLLFWYIGQPVKTVYAQAVSKALKENGMDDSIFAIVRFADGSLVNLESSWALPEGSATKLDAYMEILGTRGMARVECGYSGLWFSDVETTQFPDTQHWPLVSGEVRGDLKEELAYFAACVTNNISPRPDGEDGLRALELAWAIQVSIETGKVIEM